MYACVTCSQILSSETLICFEQNSLNPQPKLLTAVGLWWWLLSSSTFLPLCCFLGDLWYMVAGGSQGHWIYFCDVICSKKRTLNYIVFVCEFTVSDICTLQSIVIVIVISIHFHLRAIGSPFWLPSCSYKFCCAFPFHLSDTVMIPPSYSNVSWVIWHFWSKTMSLHTTVTIQPRGTSTMNMLGFILLEHWLVFCVLATFSRH